MKKKFLNFYSFCFVSTRGGYLTAIKAAPKKFLQLNDRILLQRDFRNSAKYLYSGFLMASEFFFIYLKGMVRTKQDYAPILTNVIQ
jgi:hypothetical protein